MNKSIKRSLITAIALTSIFMIAGCSSTKDAQKHSSDAATRIVTQPFKDLNMIKSDIPPALAQITDPYATPEVVDCHWLNYQLSELDKVLGPDPIRKARDERSIGEKGSDLAVEATNDAINSAATGILPARGIIRKLSGADKADKEHRNAIERGKVRRGYLTGIAEAKNCFGK